MRRPSERVDCVCSEFFPCLQQPAEQRVGALVVLGHLLFVVLLILRDGLLAHSWSDPPLSFRAHTAPGEHLGHHPFTY